MSHRQILYAFPSIQLAPLRRISWKRRRRPFPFAFPNPISLCNYTARINRNNNNHHHFTNNKYTPHRQYRRGPDFESLAARRNLFIYPTQWFLEDCVHKTYKRLRAIQPEQIVPFAQSLSRPTRRGSFKYFTRPRNNVRISRVLSRGIGFHVVSNPLDSTCSLHNHATLASPWCIEYAFESSERRRRWRYKHISNAKSLPPLFETRRMLKASAS